MNNFFKNHFQDSLLRDSPLMSVIEGHMKDLDEKQGEELDDLEEENCSPVITTPPEFEQVEPAPVKSILVAPGLR